VGVVTKVRSRVPGGFHKVGFEGGQMPLQRRLPKRGFKSMTGARNVEVRLSEIARLPVDEIRSGDACGRRTWCRSRCCRQRLFYRARSRGKSTLKGVGATAGARAAIEAAGGSVSE
jgi:large subunit ribosomal protein L15